jgi:hypothetical protein
VGLYALFSNSVVFNQDTVGTWTMRVKPEGFATLPLAGGIYAILRAVERKDRTSALWWGLAGCAFGFAAALKPSSAVFLIGAWVVALIVASRPATGKVSAAIRSTVWLAAGALLVQLIYIVPLAAQGRLRDFWEAVAVYNFGPYAKLGLSRSRFLVVSVLVGKETLVLWLLALAAFLWMLLRDRRMGNWLIVGWGVLAGAVLVLENRFVAYHYLTLVPPLCLLAAYGTVQLWRLAGRWRARSAAWVARGLLAVLLPVLLAASMAQFVRTNLDYYGRFVSYVTGRMDGDTFYGAFNTYPRHYSYPADKAVADWVGAHTEPDEPLATLGGYGATPVYLAGRPPASRYVFTYHLFHKQLADLPMIEAMRAELLASLQSSRPPYILLFRPLEDFERFGPLFEWLVANYDLERTFMHGRSLYRESNR